MSKEMTIEEAVALGRRMMACEGFEWRVGMVPLFPLAPDHTIVVTALTRRGLHVVVRRIDDTDGWSGELTDHGVVPDLRDPGTVGHALAMMRKAVGHPSASAEPNAFDDGGGWQVVAKREVWQPARTEAEAIVNAWERRVCRGQP